MKEVDMSVLLYSAHLYQTNLEPSPFPYTFFFNREMFNKEKYSQIAKNPELFVEFVSNCFEKFMQRHGDVPRGSVHYNPQTWVRFALKAIARAWKDNSTQVIFPNGCCSMSEKCPINMFYQIVLEELSM